VAKARTATITDVARLAGVSRAAVSKVIRDAYGVSPAMRERVNGAIEQLGYRPHVAARAMRGASYTLGIELPHNISNPFFAKVLDGAMDALEGTPYQLILAPVGTGSDHGARALEALVDRQVDGIVAISPLVLPSWLERLAARTPVVMLGRHDHSVAYDTVTGDDTTGAHLVMEHIAGLGHRRIAHLTRNEETTRPSTGNPHAVRLEEYLAYMREAGLAERIRVARTGPSQEAARRDTLALLREGRPTAVFAGNDELALGAMHALSDLGISPAETSVAGYDNVEIAGHPAISLTSVDQDGVLMGRQAVRLLLERIEGRTEVTHFRVEPSLRIRSSTRPAPPDPAT